MGAQPDGSGVAFQRDLGLEQVHRRRTDERGNEHVDRVVVEVLRRVDLLEVAVLEHRHSVAHRHCLDLVVGDVHRGDREFALQGGDLGTHLHAQLRVEVRQRLVHQERGRLTNDRSAHGDTLTLAAGELTGLAVEVVLQLQDGSSLADPGVDLLFGDLGELEREADVVVHGHVRIQRVVLEDHGDVAILRLDLVDDLVADLHRAAADGLEPGDHPQRGGLAATGGSDEHQELLVGDL